MCLLSFVLLLSLTEGFRLGIFSKPAPASPQVIKLGSASNSAESDICLTVKLLDGIHMVSRESWNSLIQDANPFLLSAPRHNRNCYYYC